MNFKVKILTGVIMGAFVAAVFVPAGASAKITVKDNGFGSKNHVVERDKTVKKVKQRNNTNSNTTVFAGSNTGDNETNKNTGGDTSSETGISRVTTTVDVTGGTNENTGETEGCCCGEEGDQNIVIKDNGAWSHNGVWVSDVCKDIVKQSNSTSAHTFIGVHSNTGGNEANANTNGTTTTTTGNSIVTTTVTVSGGDNINN